MKVWVLMIDSVEGWQRIESVWATEADAETELARQTEPGKDGERHPVYCTMDGEGRIDTDQTMWIEEHEAQSR